MSQSEFLESLEGQLTRKFSTKRTNDILGIVGQVLVDYDIKSKSPQSINVEDDDFLKRFLTAKEVEGRSAKTLAHYRYIITKMLTELELTTAAITVYDLRDYLGRRKDDGISDKTLEGERSVFSSYFGWLQKEGLLQSNPCANLGAIKCQKKIKLPFSEIDMAKLRDACDNSRDKALVAFLHCTGCRISEITALDRNSIDFDHLEVTVLGKGNKERTVYLDEVGAMLLQQYIAERGDTSPALFAGKGSERLTPGGVRYILSKVGRKAGVDNVHPHRFRRTLATSLINRGMSIQEVAAILGHENINTTMTYVYIDKVNVKNAYKKYF